MIFVHVTSQSVPGFTHLVTLITLKTWVHNVHSLDMARNISLQARDFLTNQASPESRSIVRQQLHLLRDQVVQL